MIRHLSLAVPELKIYGQYGAQKQILSQIYN
jgi:hypothetical protein